MATAKQRRRGRLLAVSNRLLLRHEKILLRDLRKVFASASEDLVRRARPHIDLTVTLAAVRPDLRAGILSVYRLRIRQIISLFGRQVITSLRERGVLRKSSARVSLERKDFDDEFDQAVRDFIENYAFDRADEITEQFLEQAKKTLQASFDEGMGEVDLVQALRTEFEHISETAAQRLARTEAHTAANYGSEVAAEASGLDLVKEWGATDDARTRPTHVDADGQRVPMGGKFRVGDAELDYPGDPTGPPGEVINCRCTVLYYPIINGEVID